MDVSTFLQMQSSEYQRHASRVTELTATLEQQLSMEMYKNIPKDYQPKQLKASNTSLTKEFTMEYSKLFFKHLQKVITNNQIELQLRKSTLTCIIAQTEVYLSMLPLPTSDITNHYHKFLLDNQILDRIAIPELQVKLQEETDTPMTNTQPKKRRRQKRKCPTLPPDPIKQPKQDNFLAQSPQETRMPP